MHSIISTADSKFGYLLFKDMVARGRKVKESEMSLCLTEIKKILAYQVDLSQGHLSLLGLYS